ncbi:hypothetical protein [Ideonella azotifigens]|uniref:hypothetical protein n=1 Tax=Ideonella azotifigens TaxID=513160 RepID=UPI001E343C30|nr:hypothetical protein [Ideonella azotifigens]
MQVIRGLASDHFDKTSDCPKARPGGQPEVPDRAPTLDLAALSHSPQLEIE